MPKMMQTGVDGLDQILGGGLLYHNSVLLKGAPGSGKTTLGIQIVYNGIVRFGEPGIIVLFEQFPQQLFRDLSSYGIDVQSLTERNSLRVIFAFPDQVTSRDKTLGSPLMNEIQDAAAEIGARRILVDSISHFIHYLGRESEARDHLLRFLNSLKSIGLTPIITAERENVQGAIAFEEYLLDSVLYLNSEPGRDKAFQSRSIEVRKARGQEHLRGQHPLRIGSCGVEIFPRQTAKQFEKPEVADVRLEKISTGISGLDELLGGGYTRGSCTVAAGMPGTYKTTLGMQFLARAAESGQPGLLVTFNERPQYLASLMRERGMDVAPHLDSGQLQVWHYFPKEVYIEELLIRLSKEIASGVRAVVIDGINDYEKSIEDPDLHEDMLSALLSLCASNGVTSLLTRKLDQFTSNAPLTDIKYAAKFDGIIYLGTLEIESSVHKVISVLKMRGSDYSSDLREIVCGQQGLHVSDKFVGLTGILAGNAQGQYKRTVEEIFQPLYFVRDFLEILRSPELEAEQRDHIVGNLVAETNKLVDKLKQHFDVKR